MKKRYEVECEELAAEGVIESFSSVDAAQVYAERLWRRDSFDHMEFYTITVKDEDGKEENFSALHGK
jgi:hypothetical protein